MLTKSKQNLVIGIVVCVIAMVVYNVLFFNKYLPLSYGWFSVYADYILKGQVPFRDFYYFSPPLYLYIITAFTHLFGNGLIVLSILGIVVVSAMAVLLFLVLSRIFPIYIACIASIVSMLYYQSDTTYTSYNFMSFLGLFALIGILLICEYFSSSGKRWRLIYLFLAGVFSIFTFLTKQGDGFFIVVFFFLAVVVSSYIKEGLRNAIRNVIIFSLGIIIPLLYLFIWLLANGVLSQFWSQVFVGASSSKGGIITMLFAWIPHLVTIGNIISLGLMAFIIYILRIVLSPKGFKLEQFKDGIHIKSEPKIIFLFILVVSLFCILVPFWNVNLSSNLNDINVLTFIRKNLLIIDLFVGLIILSGYYLVKLFKDKNYFNVFMISFMALGLMWGNSASGGIGDEGTLLALGLGVGLLASIPSYKNITRIIVIIFCILFSMHLVSVKYVQPYAWWGLTQPDIRTTSVTPNSKYLSGFVVSEHDAQIYNGVTEIIDKNTTPDERIYTFPNIPVFYLLTERQPSTPDISSWFDVLPDKSAENDAVKLLKSPPSAIIYLDIPEFVWQGHEIAFRDNKPSGQRQIVSAINKLTSSGKYELDAKYDVPVGYTLSVWTLKK